MPRTLSARIRFLILTLCIGFGLSIFVTFRVLMVRQVAETAHHDVETTSGMLAVFIEDRIRLLASLTRVQAVSPRVNSLADTDRATIAAEVDNLLRESQVDGITITGPDGEVYGEAGFPTSKADLANLPGVAAAVRGQSWSGIETRDGDILLAATEPLGMGEYVKATYTAYLRLGDKLAYNLKSRAPMEIAFVHEGLITASSLNLPKKVDHVVGDTWNLGVDGHSFSASYARLPGTREVDRLGFIVMRPLDDIVRPYQTFSFAFICVLVAVSLAAITWGSIFGGGIARSLDALVLRARQLKEGQWPDRLEVSRTDEIGLLEGTFNDMADALRQSQERLMSVIDVDPLTELANHRTFKETLDREAARTTASSQPLALLLLDIDCFSNFNAEHGHAAGDRVLQEVAAVLRALSPEFASSARYGGEEFALLLPGGTSSDAEELFSRIRRAVKGITLSGGCAELSSAKGRSEGLLVAAELAMERAKQLGRNQVCSFAAIPGADDDERMLLYRNLRDGTYATVKALAAAVDAKDPYTHGHSDRVARLAADLASRVGASPEEVDRVFRCGTLHDVGKIGVPDAILQKPGVLDPEEIRIMRSHAELGEYIVGKVPQLSDLLPGVRNHHERYDGGGYPDGLSGEQIPRIARFLAVADTFDAMTSDRPYRQGLSVETALAEIEKNAGAQFDPELARAFVEMIRVAKGPGAEIAATLAATPTPPFGTEPAR